MAFLKTHGRTRQGYNFVRLIKTSVAFLKTTKTKPVCELVRAGVWAGFLVKLGRAQRATSGQNQQTFEAQIITGSNVLQTFVGSVNSFEWCEFQCQDSKQVLRGNNSSGELFWNRARSADRRWKCLHALRSFVACAVKGQRISRKTLMNNLLEIFQGRWFDAEKMHPGKMCVNRVRWKTEDKCPGELVEPEEEDTLLVSWLGGGETSAGGTDRVIVVELGVLCVTFVWYSRQKSVTWGAIFQIQMTIQDGRGRSSCPGTSWWRSNWKQETDFCANQPGNEHFCLWHSQLPLHTHPGCFPGQSFQ